MKLLLFLFLLLPSSITAQISLSDVQSEKTVIERLAKRYSNIKDTNELSLELKKELSILDNKSSIILTNVFKANFTADIKDELNSTSDSLFKEALQQTKQANRADLELWTTTQYAFYLYTYRKYEASFPFFIFSIRNLDRIDTTLIISPCETYKKIGFFLMTVGDYETANNYLLAAKKYVSQNSSELASILNNLGMVNLKTKKLAIAEKYFNETIAVATASKDQLTYAKALGNIAEIKLAQKKHNEAIKLLNSDILISKKLDNTKNTIYAMVLLGKVYLAQGNISKANELLHEAETYAQSKTYLKSSDYEISSLILQIAKQTGNTKEELSSRRNLEALKETLAEMDGQDVIGKVRWAMEKQKLQFGIEDEKAKRERETFAKVIALISCFLLLVVIFFVVKRFRTKIIIEKTEYDEKISKLSLDKETSEQKLIINHQTLQSYKTFLIEKNEQIKELEDEIAKIKQTSSAYSDNYQGKIQELLNSHLMDSESWTAFKTSFIQSYPQYYHHLTKNFIGLTDSHLRIIFLSKLEMSNIEIARILGLTLDAVKKAKHRLRKKYSEDYASLFG